MPDDAYLLCAEDSNGAFLEAVGASPAGVVSGNEDGYYSGEESIAEFIGGEAEYSPRPDYPDRLRSRSVDPAARTESVAWILKVQEFYGFLPMTAYLAVSYMDRFLSHHRLPQGNEWAMQLLAVTCLSLAAKMEENVVPSLLDLQVEGTRYLFESQTISRMELLVLTALDWRLRSVTPFTFVDFFAYKADPGGEHTRCIAARATRVILAAIYDIKFLDHCPSSMAVAAVLCATGKTPSLAFGSPETIVSWCIGLAEEGITSCYRLMQKLVVSNMQRVTTAATAITTTTTTATTTANLHSEEEVSSNSSSSPTQSKRWKRSPNIGA